MVSYRIVSYYMLCKLTLVLKVMELGVIIGAKVLQVNTKNFVLGG